MPPRGSLFRLARLFPVGLSNENRCTRGTGACRIVEPPSVAAAIEGVVISEDADAVWKDSMETIDSEGVGALAPVARGREVKSSEPLGLGAGRIVKIEEREEGAASTDGCARMTVVLYSDCMLEVLSNNGRALPSLCSVWTYISSRGGSQHADTNLENYYSKLSPSSLCSTLGQPA